VDSRSDPSQDQTSPKRIPSEREVRIRKILRNGGLVAIAIAVLWLIYYFFFGRYIETTNNAYIQADEVVIAPKISGYIEKVEVADNQSVLPGQLLVQVDARDYEAAVARLKAQLAGATAGVEAAEKALGEQASQISLASAELDEARTASLYAQGNAKRYHSLAEIGAESVEKYDNARFDRDRASAAIKIRDAALRAAEARLPLLKAQLNQRLADRDALVAQLQKAENDKSATMIKSVTAGVVGSRSAREGQYVQPGQRLMTVVPTQNFYVSANFKETQLARMRVGQEAEVRVDAYGGAKLSGRVESLAPGTGAQFALIKPENATGNFTKIVQRVPVRIQLFTGPEAARLLKTGLSVEVSVQTRGGDRDLSGLSPQQ
jgi:membrane fusion protein (multidrug efflux system)